MRVNEQKELLVDLLEFAPKSPSRWDMDRKQFFGKLDATIAALPKPETVSLQVHDDLQTKHDDVLKRMRRRRSGHIGPRAPRNVRGSDRRRSPFKRLQKFVGRLSHRSSALARMLK